MCIRPAGAHRGYGRGVLKVENLTKVFGQVRAVDDLTFDVRPGVVTGFLGPNGAGKSTTMRMMLGLDRPTAGTATIDGRPYRELDHPLRQVGALLDAAWIHPNRSARSHLRWMAASNGIPARRVAEVIDLVGLSSVAAKRAGGFSLGMKQRLGLAGALLGDPHTLLFDEPVNGLDPEGIVWIRGFMRHLAAEGRTVLVSSHLLTEMSLTADHLVVIGQGRLIADSSVTDFTSRATSSVRVRSPQLPDLHRVLAEAGLAVVPGATPDGRPTLSITDVSTEQVGDIAGRAGIVLHELTSTSASLEEVFMSMTAGAVQYQGGGPPAPGPVHPGQWGQGGRQ
ncbi:putative ABC transporter ATP-binding protein YxlF [Gordonia insulae]|uniref:Putative ABC transporter ATP-binding protein YxlF n=1 Tax=Gordonia insulae TaxID=2420509 RepID=A0A3G8JQW1_9ACTN|nr:putative ABC transporter ATP-binding protein YxlF [Gordonia insulae]